MATRLPDAREAGPPVAPLSREDLPACTRTLLNRGNRRNPDVLLVEVGGRRLVVKDFAPRGALVRATIGRWITTREIRAYRRLHGHPAVPGFAGRIDALAFAVEYRPGERMSRALAKEIPEDFLSRLDAALRDMHARGVAHLDLSHRSNILLAADGSPVLIDFGSAVCLRPGGLVARLLMPWLRRVDHRALAKWRRKLMPASSGASGGGSAPGPA